MIENITILSKGGLALWSRSWCTQLKGNPINALIKHVLLEDRISEKSFHYNEVYTLKWALDNELDVIYVVIYQKSLQLLHVDELLEITRDKFAQMFGAQLRNRGKMSDTEEFKFDEEFKNILRAVEQRAEESKAIKRSQTSTPKPYERRKRGDDSGDGSEPTLSPASSPSQQQQQQKQESLVTPAVTPVAAATVHQGAAAQRDGSATQSKEPSSVEMKQKLFRERQRMLAKQPKPPKNSPTSPVSPSPLTPAKRVGKEKTTWDGAYSADLADSLNMNKSEQTNSEDDDVAAAQAMYMPDPNKKASMDEPEESIDSIVLDGDDEGGKVDTSQYQVKEKKSSGFLSFFSSLVQGSELTMDHLNPVLEKLKNQLMGKNVASEIAAKICESVGKSLEGKVVGTFTSTTRLVYEAMSDALTRILTPKRKIDVLRDVIAAREQGNPYVIVMCGVNGVGKSTSLSKIVFWLKQNNFSTLIAACDTFRSGAIEQLNVHARCLKVPLYQRGYDKEATNVAMEAIQKAKREKIDVVMIDTAGRMQDNEPLMRSLTRVIQDNKPDLVLFVGEALVGNDGVDQLVKFNLALQNLGDKELARPNTIDGIFLTKFDTIDDKVGAALSMVYTTGHPILFIGTGQTYSDLKALSVVSVVKALLK